MKTAVLIVNVGTPDKPEVKHVRKYLTQFLNDPRVIDIPWLLQKILVNFIIVPFRAPKSTKLYKVLWGVNGSPLLYYTIRVKDKLQKSLPDNYTVYAAMRYGNPSLKNKLKEIKEGAYDKLIVVPQFPHYASSSTGTVNAYVMRTMRKWNVTPSVEFINQFYDHPGYINAFVKRAQEKKYQNFDHIIFSYHGLPLRQINKIHPNTDCKNCSCILEMPEYGKWCYKATCYETSRLLAKQLNLKSSEYSVSFQSRLSKNWLEPFSDRLIADKAKENTKKILVLAPAFVADCLETEVEIGVEYAELFKENGGEELKMCESLNDMDLWINTLNQLVCK